MVALWGGRFQGETADLMKQFNESFSLDKRLWYEDMTASIAHVTMLGDQGILSPEESQALQDELIKLRSEVAEDPQLLTGDYEDIHSFVEGQLIQRLGDVGKKLHTARSRNDQVAVDMKLYVRRTLKDLQQALETLMAAFDKKADSVTCLSPAYTHLQRAQIVPFSYILKAYVAMFKRDWQKLADTVDLLNECPLGAGALAGTTFDINREQTAQLLDFKGVQENTLDAVSNRDFILDSLQCFSSLMVHMSRFAEDFIIFSSQEFAFVESADAYATGSSMMPQKKNPDALELIRGKSGKVIGLMTSMYTIMKGLPLAYNKAMQEDKAIYFEGFDTTLACVQILTGFIEGLIIKEDRLNQTVHDGYLNATELADYLVKKGIPFREAHGVVGAAVIYGIQEKKQLHELSLQELQQFSKAIQEDVYQSLDPQEIMQQGIKKQMLN